MSTFLCNKTISKRTPLHKGNPFPQFNVACYKHPGIRLSFEHTTTLLSGEGGEGRTGTATIHEFGLFSGYSQISQYFYLLSWTSFDNILLTLHTSCNRKIIHALLFQIRWIYLRTKKLLFPGMFERQDHWILGVSSIKSRSPLMNKFTGLFWNLLRFFFIALPLSKTIL